jgi:hypothetical protein
MSLVLQSSGGGSVTLAEPTTASNFTQDLPAASGTVVITGDLLVRGATQFGVSTTIVEDTNVTDRVVTLNFNETGGAIQNRGNITGDGYSGIKIARGNVAIPNRNDYAAFIEWNDNATWQGTGAVSNV